MLILDKRKAVERIVELTAAAARAAQRREARADRFAGASPPPESDAGDYDVPAAAPAPRRVREPAVR